MAGCLTLRQAQFSGQITQPKFFEWRFASRRRNPGLWEPDDLSLQAVPVWIIVVGHRDISVGFVKTVAFDLVGETNARKAKFVRRP